ncbi:hypothetical protein GpartN1_g5674.t1 [Galdieria partita]|uniref:Uncharacterized protein n=1 Tax=Galdieria partita TaxID=83374 RepID=A0A9C7USI8_9RHOD|nr:hypothetical protein GpartN1_g5674.t1 [Galdieria partita]
MQVGSPKGYFQSYLNEEGELPHTFPTRLHSNLEVFDWLFTDKPEEGFQVERFQRQLLCISGYSYSNGSHKEKVSQNYLVKCYKDGFLFLYCLNDLSWSHYAIPRPLQKYAPNISRSIFDVYTGERFDFHILSNGMILTVLAQYATSCVTLHNAVLWHPIQPGFPPSRRIYAVEVVKMSNCYRCHQSPNKCRCVQNQQRVTISSSQTTQVRTNSSEAEVTSSGSVLLRSNPSANGKREESDNVSTTDANIENGKKYSSADLNYVVDPNAIKTLFGPWKGTKRVIAYNPKTGHIEREQRSFFRLHLDWAAALEVREVQTKSVMRLFHNLFNPTVDLLVSFPEQEKGASPQYTDFIDAENIVDDCHLKEPLDFLTQNAR